MHRCQDCLLSSHCCACMYAWMRVYMPGCSSQYQCVRASLGLTGARCEHSLSVHWLFAWGAQLFKPRWQLQRSAGVYSRHDLVFLSRDSSVQSFPLEYGSLFVDFITSVTHLLSRNQGRSGKRLLVVLPNPCLTVKYAVNSVNLL